MASSDIEIQLITEHLSDHFLITPNSLHRAEDDWAGMTLRGRAMLSAILSLKSGWKTSRKAVDRLAPELKRDGVNTVLRELKDRRHLYVRRINTGGGRFTWQWVVYLRPQPEGFDPFALDAISAGRTIDGSSSNGDDQGKRGVSAGRTIDGSAVDGSAIDGRMGGHKKYLGSEVPDLRSTEELPPTPRAATPASTPPVSPTAKAGGGNPEQGKPDLLAAAIAQAATIRRGAPNWGEQAIADVVAEAIQQGRPEPLIVAGIIDLARGAHGPTTYPRRLLSPGPWWDKFIPAPVPDRSRMCRTHQGEPADNCGRCASERLGMPDDDDEGPALKAAAARAAIRKTIGTAKRPPARRNRINA